LGLGRLPLRRRARDSRDPDCEAARRRAGPRRLARAPAGPGDRSGGRAGLARLPGAGGAPRRGRHGRALSPRESATAATLCGDRRRSMAIAPTRLLLPLLLACIASRGSAQQTVVVQGGGQAFAQAVAAAAHGDTLLVRPGTYDSTAITVGIKVLCDPGVVFQNLGL